MVFAVGCTSAMTLPTPIAPAALPTPNPIADTQRTLPATLTPTSRETAVDTPTFAASLNATPTPIPFPTPITYMVEEGDNPSAIAAQFSIDLQTLLDVNSLSLESIIYPGQNLIIPPAISDDAFTLPIHIVRPGDTLSTIAAAYGVDIASLQQANTTVNPDVLQVGQPLQIPIALGEVHYTVPGDTLLALAIRYNTDVDAFLLANPNILDLGNPDFVPVGVLLNVPQEQVVTGYDCNPQPARTAVITYTIANGEKLFCLGSKFGVSITTLLRANPHIIGENALQDGAVIRVPPTDGAFYEITLTDVARNTTLQDLRQWYGLANSADIVDVTGNLVSDPLGVGQQLFIQDADLLAGDYAPEPVIIAEAAPTPGNDNVIGELPPTEIVTPALPVATPTPIPGSDSPPSPVGDAPAGAVRPRSNPWSGEMTEYDTGYCGDVADGYGWSGTLIWPVDSKQIRENRGFRQGHGAIDIEIALDSSVYAAAPGEVVWAGYSRWGGGNMIVIAHGNTRQTHYAHLNTVSVSCGQSVSQGQIIGTVGQTGASSFPHLHFEVRSGGFSYDPFLWLP